MKRAVCVVIAFLLMTNLFACGIQPPETIDDSPAEEELFEIVWPEIILNRLGSTAEEEAKSIEEIKDQNIYSALRVNDDNTLTVILTEEQRKNSLNLYVGNLEGFIKTYYETADLQTELSEDYSEIAFYIDGESDLMETVNGLYVIMSMALVARLYETVNTDEITVHVKLYDVANGRLLTEADIPWEDIDLTPEMWENEEGLSAEAYSRKPLTENQEKILRSCGMTSRKIEEMKEEGVPELTEEFVAAAEIVLEKMQARYGMSFMVQGGTIPDWSSADFTFMLCVADGELAGKTFGAAYRLESGGERRLYEEYYTLKRCQEVQKDVQNIADQLGTGIKVIAYAEGEIGEDVLPASEEAIQNIRIDILGFMPKETRTELIQSAAENLYEEIKTYEVKDYRVYRVRHNSTLGRLVDYESIDEVFPMGVSDATDYLCEKGIQ